MPKATRRLSQCPRVRGKTGEVNVESGKAEYRHSEGVLGCPGGALKRRLVWEGKVVWGLRKAGLRAQWTLDLKGQLRLA